jgi:hypothetical protein
MRAFYEAMDRYTLASDLGGAPANRSIQMHKMFWSGTTAGTSKPELNGSPPSGHFFES